MLTSELEFVLYQEHQKEKKISIRNFIIVAAILLVVIAVAFLFFSKQVNQMAAGFFSNGVPMYVKILLPVMFLGILVYPSMVLMESIKRETKIKEVIDLLTQGKVADHFNTEKIYKTTIPLLKINFKLNPFHYLHFKIANKLFKLPVPISLIPDATAVLSGANMQKVNSIWNELHADGQSETESESAVSLKTMEEFKTFAAGTLNDRADTMEKGRKKTKRQLVTWIVITFLGVGGFVFYNYQRASNNAATGYSSPEAIQETVQNEQNFSYKILIVFGIVMLASFGYYLYTKKKYKNVETVNDGSDYTTFKEYIFKTMVDFINPSFEYIKASYIGREEIADSGIFVNKAYDIGGNDLIVGRHQGVPFQYSDVSIGYKRNFSNEKEGPDSVFAGQYFIAKFNKRFATPVYVFSKASVGGFFTNNDIHTYLDKSLPKVTLEDPEFDKQFDVYCSDQVAARYILSTSLMQRIKDLSVKGKKAELFLAFHNNKVSVLNNTKRDKFEVSLFTKIKPELLEEFYDDLYKQLKIIEEMKLDVNIWR